MVDAEGDVLNDHEIVNLRGVLAWACRNSRYGEIRFKSYEILFFTFSRSPNFVDFPPLEQIKDKLERVKGSLDKQEWDMHLVCLADRRRLVGNALFRLNLDNIHRLREEYEKPGKPLTPSTSYDMIRNPSCESYGSMDRHSRRSINPFELPRRLRPLEPCPPSPTNSSHTDSSLIKEPTWQENPMPFPADDPLSVEPAKRKIKGTPVSTRISQTGRSLAILSRNHVDVYAVSVNEFLGLTQLLEYDAPRGPSGTSYEFIAVALDDDCVVALSRNQVSLYHLLSMLRSFVEEHSLIAINHIA